MVSKVLKDELWGKLYCWFCLRSEWWQQSKWTVYFIWEVKNVAIKHYWIKKITSVIWKAKVGSQEIPGVTGKFGLGVQNEVGQRLREFCQGNALVIANTLFQQHHMSTYGHHQMVNTETRLIIFFAAENGEALYSQQKQDLELTVAQIMSSLLQNSGLNWRKWGKPLGHWSMPLCV